MENKNCFTADENVVRRQWHKYFSDKLKFHGNHLTSTPNRTPIKGPPMGAIIVKRIIHFDLFRPSSPSDGGNKRKFDETTGSISEDASSTGSILEDASSTGRISEDASSTGSISEDASSTGRFSEDASSTGSILEYASQL